MGLRSQILKLTDPFLRLPVAGLDISDRTMKYLAFKEKRGRIDFEFWGEIEIPEGIIENGEIKKEGEMINLLRAWLAKEGRKMRFKFAAVSLPEEKSFLRLLQLPKVKKEEIGGAIRWEIEANIPLAPEELIYDYEVFEPPEKYLDHLDVVVTAFPKLLVESYVRVLSQAGIKLYSFELESQAIMRAIFPSTTEQKPIIVLDLGRQRSSIIIFSGSTIIFTRTLEVGGRTFEENIRRFLNIDANQAIAIKKEVGLNKKAEGGRIFSALLPAVEIISRELARALEYYRAHTLHTHGIATDIDKILLSGGDANLFGLDTYLAGTLHIQVKLADPWIRLKSDLSTSIPPIPKNQALGFTTTVGLAIKGLPNL